MPGIRATSGALAVVACATVLAACGGEEESGPIPQESGTQLIDQLSQIEDQIGGGDCEAAQQTALAFANSVDQLPQEVDGELRERLVEASANLEALTQDPEQCMPTGPSGETGALPPESEETTLPEETTETPTTDEDEETPPDGGPADGGPPSGSPGGGNQGNQGNQGGGPGGSGDDDSSGGIGSDD